MNKLLSVLLLLTVMVMPVSKFMAQGQPATSLVNKTAAALLVDEARKFYNEGNIRAALTKFREAYNKDPLSYKAALGIGQCQYDIKNYGFALKYARIALEIQDKEDPETNYLIARTYHRSLILDSALLHYGLAEVGFSPKRSSDLDLKTRMEEVKLATKLMKDTARHERFLYTGDINSGFQDYAPILAEGGNRIYFVSRRNNTTGGMINPSDQMFFEDIFTGVWNEDLRAWDSINNDFKRLNTAGFDAISHLSPDEKTMYLTINNTMVPKVKNRTQSSDIFVSKKSDKNVWSTPKSIGAPINSSYYDGAATLTEDGQTMYFVSEQSGSMGHTDIFMSKLVGGKWSKPTNLGPNINTPGKETTPYITPDGQYLFFSSDSRGGMGGYDVYVSKNQDGQWSKPYHLGYGINSINDDTHFRYYPEYRKGVLASIILTDNKSSYAIFSIEMGFFEYPEFDFSK
jgi:tetratricopeptide (TPR) repeat protein